jgi:CubicO group peptidase (beta-lactamase class C family)
MRLLLACLLIFTAPASAAAQADPLRGLDAYITGALRDWQVPGLAIAVVRNDSVIFARGYGVREQGRSERVDEHTLFAIASTSKAFTSAALGMLVDDGRIRWDDAVSDHLSGFALQDPFMSRELTVRDLLTHRAGLARSDNLWIAAPIDRTEVLRRVRYLPASSFRAEYGYNNLMYIAAGEVVGAASGTSWDDFLQTRIFSPLGMTRSTTRAAVVDTRENVATSHTKTGDSVVVMARRNYDNIGGAGAVWSSAHDMAQWVRLHLGGGSYRGRQLIRPGTVKELHTPQTVMRSDSVSERMFPHTHFRAYGLGWYLQDYHGRKLVHHSGSINFTRTHVGMVPAEGIGVVVMANLSTSNLQQALMYRVLDALLGLPVRDWSAEYLVLARRSDEASARQARATEAARVGDTRPSLRLEDYAGTYRSQIYGDARVALEQGRLVLEYAPDYTADLAHWHFDTFRGHWRRTGFGTAFVTFALNSRGRVASLNLEGFGDFARVPVQGQTQ